MIHALSDADNHNAGATLALNPKNFATACARFHGHAAIWPPAEILTAASIVERTLALETCLAGFRYDAERPIRADSGREALHHHMQVTCNDCDAES
jgi:hypothetical protein